MTAVRTERLPGPVTAAERSTAARVYYFDYLRFWATLAVVLIHSSAQVYSATRTRSVDFWSHYTVADASEGISRFAVPCFFMISGALLLDPAHRFRLGRQLARVGIPLAVWTAVYIAADDAYSHSDLPTIPGPSDPTGGVGTALRAFVSGPVSDHLWFVYVLLGLYLVFPLLRPLTALPDPTRRRLLEYALALWATVYLVIPAVNHFAPHTVTIYSDTTAALPSKYLGFVLLGYYLHRYQGEFRGRRPSRGLLLAVAAASVTTILLLTFWDEIRGAPGDWAQSNPTPQIAIFGACVFLLAQRTVDRPGRSFGFVALVSRLSYRIYLIHLLVLHYLRAISPLKNLYTDQPEVSIVLLWAITLVVSFAVAWAVDRLGPIRNYI
jgi:surface polysaccharide O-acyltransferase-like enzyme